jgi:hypothetical protein
MGICGTIPNTFPVNALQPVTVSTDMDQDFLKLHSFDFDVVEFKDLQGKLKFRLSQAKKDREENGLNHSTGRKIFFDGKYYLATSFDEKEVSDADYLKTGMGRRTNNEVTVYDLEGNTVFHQTGVSYYLSAISGNGKTVAGVNSADFTVEPAHPIGFIPDTPPQPRIYVFSADGKPLYQCSDDGIDGPVLSPSGNLLAYSLNGPAGVVKIVDLETKKEYFIPDSKTEIGKFTVDEFTGITDDGTLFRRYPESFEKLPDGSFKRTGWKTVDLYQLKR